MNAPVEPRMLAPARTPRARASVRMLVVDAERGTHDDVRVDDLATWLAPGDVLVVNDAATLPGSLPATHDGAPLKLRLIAPDAMDTRWHAVAFGAGNWRTRTEDRAPPPSMRRGDVLRVGPTGAALVARVVAVSTKSERLLELSFAASVADVWRAIYAWGRPVQYAHLDEPLELWSVQTAYAGRPWAAEAPSAGLPLSFALFDQLRRRGVALLALTHAAGLSATGDAALDRALPLPERYDIPARTVATLAACRERGGRVIAAGTTVVRALESAASLPGGLRAGAGIATIKIGPTTQLRVVEGLLTGMHDPSETHYQLMSAFAPPALLASAWRHAASASYLQHEFGDACLLLRERVRR